ncbi:MAG: hypothetical protein KJO28_04250 [Desulfofustis sp.]|nr:hypothetical protein [Desulfofustis sp.]
MTLHPMSFSAGATIPGPPPDQRPSIGVASGQGVLINQHLGEARTFKIWDI